MPPGVMSSSIFQAVGKGTTSLILTVLRELVFATLFAYIFAIPLGMGQQGVWWGIVTGNIFGGINAYIWARLYIKRLEKHSKSEETSHEDAVNLNK
jgi:Na+-driven multidrug efflux pump